MTITFVSNYINHHQAPVADELYRLTDGGYRFIQTEPMEEERIRLGWNPEYVNRPYVKLYYECKEECDRLIMESDCVIFGGCEDSSIIMPRLEAGKFTLIYSERLYKSGRWKFISPRGLVKKYHDHVRFNKYPVYLLCAGAYVKGDFDLIGAYRGKKFKYGYFPAAERYDDPDAYRRDNRELKIYWASRFIDWKHPEMMIDLAEELSKLGKPFKIKMTGTGELLEKTKQTAKDRGLADVIEFTGNLSPEEVRRNMLSSDIFILTSDRLEGWGAVLNEAMNSGCLTIASKAVGAAPYLIKDGENGLLFKAKNGRDLLGRVKAGFDPELRKRLGHKAYTTITELWNPEVAAKRLFDYIKDGGSKMPDHREGPMSKA